MTAPLDLVASMVLDTGDRWGERATDSQWADMRALFDPDGPRRHAWLRSRGFSKTTDTGAATLGLMLSGSVRGGDELYAAAAGREQAGHLARKMRLIAECTPELSGSVDVQNFRVVTPRTGAVLDVISADLATSWGKTPRWLFVDEFCNHDGTETAKGFLDSLLTSLPKRRDSVCVMASTPSSPSHWSHALWLSALADPLWRCSVSDGPAPWQDPVELESERRRLSVAMWRRLFLCEWAELDDQLATLEQVRACIGHDGILAPDPRYSYVTTADLSYARDVTAVSVCHSETRAGREVLVLDRLAAWRPKKGRQVPLAEVGEYVSDRVAEYGGSIVADPYQAMVLVQGWKEQGLQVKEAKFNPQENSRRASLLLSLIRERQLDLPDDPDLFAEITSLRLAEGSTPGVLKLTTEASAEHHFDRAMTLMMAAQELMSRPAGSWLSAYSMTRCPDCETTYPEHWPLCPKCHPAEARSAPQRQTEPPPPPPSPAGWASAYGAQRCASGLHMYIVRQHPDGCPKCRPGGAGRSLFGSLPFAGLRR